MSAEMEEFMFSNTFNNGMLLEIFVDTDDEELKQIYRLSATQHNDKVKNNPDTYDAGFDIYTPEDISIDYYESRLIKVDHKIKCRARLRRPHGKYSGTAFYTYARSSISGTCLRLANNQGIIDAGYRGNIIGKFDVLSHDLFPTRLAKHTRLLQICSPNLSPIYVKIVDTLADLGEETSRGIGGFGSTVGVKPTINLDPRFELDKQVGNSTENPKSVIDLGKQVG